jgi:hypothetical protein
VEPGGDTVTTLTNPNIVLPSALPPEKTTTRFFNENEFIENQRPQCPITFLVWSKQLTAASLVFNVILTRWGERNKTDGRFYISAEEWDSAAMLVFLKGIHGRSVPRGLTRGRSNLILLAAV